MAIVKVVLLTVLVTVGVGCVVGVYLGKQAVKKVSNQSKPLLTPKERIVYASMMAAGVACILLGVFLVPRLTTNQTNTDMMGQEEFMMQQGAWEQGQMGAEAENPATQIPQQQVAGDEQTMPPDQTTETTQDTYTQENPQQEDATKEIE